MHPDRVGPYLLGMYENECLGNALMAMMSMATTGSETVYQQ